MNNGLLVSEASMVYALASLLRDRSRVVNIGGGFGASTVAILKGTKELKDFHMWSIDIVVCEDEAHNVRRLGMESKFEQIIAPSIEVGKTWGWSAIDKVPAFKNTLTKAGFTLTEGRLRYQDFVKDTCQGKLPDTLANIPWPSTYMVIGFGAAEQPQDMFWQLGENEAIVLVGQTPPSAKFFSYQTFLINLPGSNDRLGVPIGDWINIGTIRTIGSDKFNQPIVYIITGNSETESRVRAAARKAGYPDAIINVETIPPAIGPLGKGNQGSVFAFGHRVAVAQNQTDLLNYVQNAPKNFAVLRVSPNEQLAAQLAGHPEPVPVLRTRGTGHTEMELYPSLKELRQAILSAYTSMPVKELDTKVWMLTTLPDNREMIVEKPYVGLQPKAQEAFERFYETLGSTRVNGRYAPVHQRLATHWARLVELLFAAERMLELITDPEITNPNVRLVVTSIPDEGVGSVEAPRGTLTHHYCTDEKGILTKVNLIVGTTNNNAPMTMSVRKAAQDLIKKGTVISDGLLNRIEMAFRNYAYPCMSCATHTLPGQMPLEVIIRDATGKEVDRLSQYC